MLDNDPNRNVSARSQCPGEGLDDAILLPNAHERLVALRKRARDDIRMLQYPKRQFPSARLAGVLEVAVVGAGQISLGTSFGLLQHGIRNLLIIDPDPRRRQGSSFGYGPNLAKNEIGGLEWGIPNLHHIRWIEACYGAAHCESFQKFPRARWVEYLEWYAETVELSTLCETEVLEIRWCKIRGALY